MFENIIIMTDLDGTILDDKKHVSEKDMATIDEIRKDGGLFTLATGRGYSMARPEVEKLGVDIPAVIFNGSAVYDFKEDKFLWHSALPKKARKYVEDIKKRFPTIGIEVLMEQKVYVIACNDTEIRHLAFENLTPELFTFDEMPEGDWLKILTDDVPEVMDEVQRYVEAHIEDYEGVDWVRSGELFYEILPKGVNKGTGFMKLVQLLDCGDRLTVAMGDYYNDLEMIKRAKLGVAVANAQSGVLAAADLVVTCNNDSPLSAVADYIRKSNTKENI